MNSLLVTWSLADPVTTSNITQDTKFWGLWITCFSLIGLVFLLATVLVMMIYNSDKLFSALVPVKRNAVQVNQDVHELLSESAQSSLY